MSRVGDIAVLEPYPARLKPEDFRAGRADSRPGLLHGELLSLTKPPKLRSHQDAKNRRSSSSRGSRNPLRFESIPLDAVAAFCARVTGRRLAVDWQLPMTRHLDYGLPRTERRFLITGSKRPGRSTSNRPLRSADTKDQGSPPLNVSREEDDLQDGVLGTPLPMFDLRDTARQPARAEQDCGDLCPADREWPCHVSFAIFSRTYRFRLPEASRSAIGILGG